jgi:hypothetical protein
MTFPLFLTPFFLDFDNAYKGFFLLEAIGPFLFGSSLSFGKGKMGFPFTALENALAVCLAYLYSTSGRTPHGRTLSKSKKGFGENLQVPHLTNGGRFVEI